MPGASQYTANDYPYYHAKALKGLTFGVEHGFEEITAITTEVVEFGQAVAYAGGADTTGRPTVKLPSAATDLIMGVVPMRHRTPRVYEEPIMFTNPADSSYTNFPAKYSIPVRKVGKLYVYSETPVDLTLPVFVRYAPGAGLLQVGNFRGTAVAGEAVQLNGARWFEKTTAPGLAIIDLNLPA